VFDIESGEMDKDMRQFMGVLEVRIERFFFFFKSTRELWPGKSHP
jgi:hypothetical protein